MLTRSFLLLSLCLFPPCLNSFTLLNIHLDLAAVSSIVPMLDPYLFPFHERCDYNSARVETMSDGCGKNRTSPRLTPDRKNPANGMYFYLHHIWVCTSSKGLLPKCQCFYFHNLCFTHWPRYQDRSLVNGEDNPIKRKGNVIGFEVVLSSPIKWKVIFLKPGIISLTSSIKRV